MNINQLISSTVSDQVTKGVSEKLGIPQDKSQGIIDMAIPLLLGGLAKNSKNTGGAENLLQALSNDHDGSILNDIPSAINTDSTQEEGGKILNHILGAKQGTVSQAIGSQVQINPNQVQQVLTLLAPIVMGALGKQQRQNGFDTSGLSGFLLKSLNQSVKKSPKNSSILTQILDRNNDGSAVDDVVNIGLKALGGLFKK